MTIPEFCVSLRTMVEANKPKVRLSGSNINLDGYCPLQYFLRHGEKAHNPYDSNTAGMAKHGMSNHDAWVIMGSADDRRYAHEGNPDKLVRRTLLEICGLREVIKCATSSLILCLISVGCLAESSDTYVVRNKAQSGDYCVEKGGVPIFNMNGLMTNCILPCKE